MSHVDAARTKRSRPGVIVPLAVVGVVVVVVVVVAVPILWSADHDVEGPPATTTPASDRDAAAAEDAVDALIAASEREDCDTIVDLMPPRGPGLPES
jgi:hypothetical protein